MAQSIQLYIIAFTVAFVVSVVLTPVAKKLAYKFKAIDYPRSRGMNKEPVPRMGGFAIVLGFMCSMLVLSVFMKELHTKQFLGFICGGAIIVIVGMLDDVYQLSAKVKLVFQIIVGIIVVSTGTKLNFIMWPMWQYLKPFSAPITVFWIVGLINAVNLIDGLDGLAAGVTCIESTCLAILCTMSGSTLAAVITIALAGAAMGFLPRNFAPAEIYMGDTGSTFLGYVLAVCSCIGVFKSYALLSVLLSVLAMALPILDTSFAMIRRAANHKPIMSPDRGHLHHKLIDMGYTSKQAVIILYALSIGSATMAVIIALQDIRATITLLIFFLIIIILLVVRMRHTQE
ncbi:MAG TPA: undecaprenyl-phosphate alpha-N-acetylglucosaminyl 1-phosphate transferase [Lachnospiraceae bacterium]|nr:undecaprenyl-phosphate alpha-N-acetylglucosaminyl 1-phosphate transferase [Lachnospiraceae bacterium]